MITNDSTTQFYLSSKLLFYEMSNYNKMLIDKTIHQLFTCTAKPAYATVSF